MNDIPRDVIAEILAMSDHATKASALMVNKTFYDILGTYDDLWTDAEFRRYDDTLIGFFLRHRVRTLRLMCTPEDACSVLTTCAVSSLRSLTMKFGYVDALPDGFSHVVELHSLEHLDVSFGNVGCISSFVVPRSNALRSVKIVEKSDPRVDVTFDCKSPFLTDIDIRSRSCSVTVDDTKNLRRVRIIQDTFVSDDVGLDLRGADLDFLELDVVDDSVNAIRAKTFVARVGGLAYFHEPFAADNLRFAFSETDCILNLHHDVVSAAKTVSFAAGIQHVPFVSWHVSVEHVPMAEVGAMCAKMSVEDPRTNLSFLRVVT